MKKTDPPIVVEQEYKASIETVWNAITNINLMKQWYFDNIPDFQPVVGFTTRFTVQSETRKFPHLWEVIEVVPLQKISYTWRFDGYQGDSYVSFELSSRDNVTALKLTVTVTEDFPDEIPEFQRESCIEGWNYFLGSRLHDYLKQSR